MKLEDVIEKHIKEVCKGHIELDYYFAVERDHIKLAQAIINWFKTEIVPKWKVKHDDKNPYNCYECGDEGWVAGYNECLDQINEKLEIQE